MKAVTLISDLFMLIALMAMTVLMALFIWALIEIYEVESFFNVVTPRQVEFDLFTKPVSYDAEMLAFLEFEENGIPMKKLIEAVAIQNSTTVWLNGSSINVTETSEAYLNGMIEKDYLLKIVYPSSEIKVASFGTLKSIDNPLAVQKVSTKLFLLNGEMADLQLFVGG